MGILDSIVNAAKIVGKVVTNPVKTIENIGMLPYTAAKYLVDTANSLDEMPVHIKELVQSPTGNIEIAKITVFREPVNRLVVGAVKVLTLGKLVTKIRHVFEVFVLKGEKERFIRVEKNEIVEWKEITEQEYKKMKKEKENEDVPLHQKESIATFFKNYVSKTDPKKLWLYDPITANCQVFVYLGLITNGIEVDKQLENFIVQENVKQQVQNVSREIMKGVTTAANFMRRVIGADGEIGSMTSNTMQEALNEHDKVSSLFIEKWHRMAPAVRRQVIIQMDKNTDLPRTVYYGPIVKLGRSE
jgi:hypothetical protein